MRSLVSRWPTELLLPVLIAGLETAAIAPLIHIFGTGFLFLQPLSAPWPLAIGAIGLLAFWSTRIRRRASRFSRGGAHSLVHSRGWHADGLAQLAIRGLVGTRCSRRAPVDPRYLIVPVVLSVLAWWRGLILCL